jgi:hypothetical protein
MMSPTRWAVTGEPIRFTITKALDDWTIQIKLYWARNSLSLHLSGRQIECPRQDLRASATLIREFENI